MSVVERVARALVISRGAAIVASDEHWPDAVVSYRKMCAEWPDYANGRSLITDTFRDARAAIRALEPTQAMYDAAAQALFDDVCGGSSGLDDMVANVCMSNAKLALDAAFAILAETPGGEEK